LGADVAIRSMNIYYLS